MDLSRSFAFAIGHPIAPAIGTFGKRDATPKTFSIPIFSRTFGDRDSSQILC